MKIDTRKFGEIEIDEKKIMTMPDGLLGFPGFERFVLIEDPKTVPFCWFQSVEGASLALVVINPFVFKPDYSFDLKSVMDARKWKDAKEKELLVYVVVNISENGDAKKITANLMGPLVINPKANEAVQVVMPNSDYSHQHLIIESS